MPSSSCLAKYIRAHPTSNWEATKRRPTLPKKRTVADPSLGSSPMRLQASMAPYISCRPSPAPQASSRAESASTFSHSYCRQGGHIVWGFHSRPGGKLRPFRLPVCSALAAYGNVPKPGRRPTGLSHYAAGQERGPMCIACSAAMGSDSSSLLDQCSREWTECRPPESQNAHTAAARLTVLCGCTSWALASVWGKQDLCGPQLENTRADCYRYAWLLASGSSIPPHAQPTSHQVAAAPLVLLQPGSGATSKTR